MSGMSGCPLFCSFSKVSVPVCLICLPRLSLAFSKAKEMKGECPHLYLCECPNLLNTRSANGVQNSP